MSARALDYNPTKPSAFSTENKLSEALSGNKNLTPEPGWNNWNITLRLGLSGNGSCAITTLCGISWTCVNAIYWKYIPSQNSMILTDRFYLLSMFSRRMCIRSLSRQRAARHSLLRFDPHFTTMIRPDLRGYKTKNF